jgi:hypothetical protein
MGREAPFLHIRLQTSAPPLLLSWTLLCHGLVSRNAKRNQDSLYQLVREGFLHGSASCSMSKLYSFDRVCQDSFFMSALNPKISPGRGGACARLTSQAFRISQSPQSVSQRCAGYHHQSCKRASFGDQVDRKAYGNILTRGRALVLR